MGKQKKGTQFQHRQTAEVKEKGGQREEKGGQPEEKEREGGENVFKPHCWCQDVTVHQ